nr:MAG TPA: hypothetical protein [Bacteriophage sp.]
MREKVYISSEVQSNLQYVVMVLVAMSLIRRSEYSKKVWFTKLFQF